MKNHSAWQWSVTVIFIFVCSMAVFAAPSGFVKIPAGAFTMGDTLAEGYPRELPTHSVYISEFFMEVVEVTRSQYDVIHDWANSNGYAIGSCNPTITNHPANGVTWYNCVKWCNARSEKEGLTPCYYTTPAQTTVYRSGDSNLTSDCVNWSANGYRLPTEAEWEKAARGGLVGYRFPWSGAATISHTLANFRNDGGESYATGTTGYHPAYSNALPYTSPVGSFEANNYGLYDMAGNIWELCWDPGSDTYYSVSPGTDPRGPAPNTHRIVRGGCWQGFAIYCRCADRAGWDMGVGCNYVGFRCARGTNGVESAVSITTQPESLTVDQGSSASFTVVASGTAPLYYQWQKNSANIASANSMTYTIASAATNDAGTYRCVVSNLASAVTSSVAVLTVNEVVTPPPAPAGVSASSGTYTDKVAVTWNAVGGASGYQVWRAAANNLALAVRLGNATPASYDDNSSAVRLATIFYYWVKAYNSAGTSDFSSVASGFCKMSTDPGMISGQPVVGDYDGDNMADPAVYNLSNGRLFVWLSSAGYVLVTPVATFQVSAGDLPVAGDFDGDGLADPGVFNRAAGSWYVWLSRAGYNRAGPVLYGLSANDIPVPADFDGDGNTDPAVYQAASGGWYVWLSSAGYMKVGPFPFQQSLADIPVPGQFDGGHLADPAVYQQASGAWYLWLSSAGYVPLGPVIHSTTEDHIAVPADYDGDGLCDPAVYVPSLGKWRLWQSGRGYDLTEMELR